MGRSLPRVGRNRSPRTSCTGFHNEMNQARVRDVLARLQSLPTLPVIATQALIMASSESTDAKELAQLIENDPALAGKLLSSVNNVGRGLTRELTSINEAIVMLGLKTVRSVVLSVQVFEYFEKQHVFEDDFSRQLWIHSIAAASFAHGLARRRKAEPEKAYAGGLLHDIGLIALYSLYPEEYRTLVLAGLSGEKSLCTLEEEAFGLSHTECGKFLAQRWKFPEAIIAAVAHHHQPPGAKGLDEDFRDYAESVAFGDILSRYYHLGFDEAGVSNAEMTAWMSHMEFDIEEVEGIARDVAKSLDERLVLLNQKFDAIDVYFDAVVKANAALGRISQDFDRLARRRGEHATVFEALHTMNAAIEPEMTVTEVLHVLAGECRRGLDASMVLCYSVNRKSKFLLGHCARPEATEEFFVSLTENNTENIEAISRDTSLLEAMLRQVILGSADTPARQRRTPKEISPSLWMFPLASGGRLIGGLVADFRGADEKPMAVYTADRAVISAFAGACEVALARAMLKEALERSNSQLLTEQRERQRVQAELLQSRKLAAIGQMAAGAAHEINNPLAIVSGNTQMLLKKEQTASKRQVLEGINKQCKRMSRIVSDLLGYARPSPPALQEVDLGAFIEQMAAKTRQAIADTQVQFDVVLPDEIPQILADPDQIEGVFDNLISNALYAMREKGGNLKLILDGDYTDRFAKISVSDDGQGIDPENIDKVFDPFFSTKEVGEGTGLGLSLSYATVKAHGGKITLASRKGKGSTFTVFLPLERNK